MTTNDRIAALKLAAEEATPGDWGKSRSDMLSYRGSDGKQVSYVYPPDPNERIQVATDNPVEDAAFIALAKRDVPWLIDHAAALQAELSAARETIQSHEAALRAVDEALEPFKGQLGSAFDDATRAARVRMMGEMLRETKESLRDERINGEMADGCLSMIKDYLISGGIDMSHTPAMMYPEAIGSLIFKMVNEHLATERAAHAETRSVLEVTEQRAVVNGHQWDASVKIIAEQRAILDGRCETCNGTGIMEVDGLPIPPDEDNIPTETAACAECNGTGLGWIADIIKARDEALRELETAESAVRQIALATGRYAPEMTGREAVMMADEIADTVSEINVELDDHKQSLAMPAPAPEPPRTFTLAGNPPKAPDMNADCNGRWLLVFDDQDHDQLFYDSEVEARAAYDAISINWNCTLYPPLATYTALKDYVDGSDGLKAQLASAKGREKRHKAALDSERERSKALEQEKNFAASEYFNAQEHIRRLLPWREKGCICDQCLNEEIGALESLAAATRLAEQAEADAAGMREALGKVRDWLVEYGWFTSKRWPDHMAACSTFGGKSLRDMLYETLELLAADHPGAALLAELERAKAEADQAKGMNLEVVTAHAKTFEQLGAARETIQAHEAAMRAVDESLEPLIGRLSVTFDDSTRTARVGMLVERIGELENLLSIATASCAPPPPPQTITTTGDLINALDKAQAAARESRVQFGEGEPPAPENVLVYKYVWPNLMTLDGLHVNGIFTGLVPLADYADLKTERDHLERRANQLSATCRRINEKRNEAVAANADLTRKLADVLSVVLHDDGIVLAKHGLDYAISAAKQDCAEAYAKLDRLAAAMPGAKYRASRDDESGWHLVYGPRRPISARITVAGPMAQEKAQAIADHANGRLAALSAQRDQAIKERDQFSNALEAAENEHLNCGIDFYAMKRQRDGAMVLVEEAYWEGIFEGVSEGVPALNGWDSSDSKRKLDAITEAKP